MQGNVLLPIMLNPMRGTTRREGATSTECHRIDGDVGRHLNIDPPELRLKERQIESDVVPNQSRGTAEHLHEVVSDVWEAWGIDEVRCGETVDAGWPHIALRVDEGGEFCLNP
jgi:hypothetical protein